jgi:hypothetical protein
LNEAVEECRQRVEVGILTRGINIESGSKAQPVLQSTHTKAKPLSNNQATINTTTMNTATMNTLKQLSEYARKSA